MGCVPHRANGVRPERAAWLGAMSVSDVKLELFPVRLVCPNYFCAFLDVDVVVGVEWFEG